MDLLLIFFLLGLLLQGIKALLNYLISRSEYFDDPLVSTADKMEYANQLSSVPVNKEVNKRGYVRVSPEINSSMLPGQTNGKEVFMPSSFHQSA